MIANFGIGTPVANVRKKSYRFPRDHCPGEGIMHRTIALLTMTTSLAFGGSAIAQEKINIVSSTYSSDDQHKKDCTAAVKSKCEDQTSCTFVYDDNICGSPDSGQSSNILVTEYKCGLASLQNHTKQKETVTLACY